MNPRQVSHNVLHSFPFLEKLVASIPGNIRHLFDPNSLHLRPAIGLITIRQQGLGLTLSLRTFGNGSPAVL
jgi:hypothetical protein